MANLVNHPTGQPLPEEQPPRFERVVRWRWWIICAAGIAILALEYFEHPHLDHFDIFHVGEIILYVVLLILVGVLLLRLSSALNAQARAAKILETRHQLSLQLATALNWDELTARILQSLAAISQPTCAVLLVHEPVSSAYEKAAEWSGEGEDCPDSLLSQPGAGCNDCAFQAPYFAHRLRNCVLNGNLSPSNGINSFCLPLVYGNTLVAMIRYQLPAETTPSAEQTDTLNIIGNEMAIALVMAQQRKALDDIKLAEAALVERRSVSRDLHDNLGQNLSYLCLMLDKLEMHSPPEMKAELGEMRAVADESLALVRGFLTVLHPDTQPHLEKLLREQGQLTAKRANFTIDLQSEGQPRPVISQVQRQILYIYREVLRNIEQHAGAREVAVTLRWGESDLTLSIVDDGVGFDPQSVDTTLHFGLVIIRERVELLNGKLELVASPNAGTRLNIWLPV